MVVVRIFSSIIGPKKNQRFATIGKYKITTAMHFLLSQIFIKISFIFKRNTINL